MDPRLAAYNARRQHQAQRKRAKRRSSFGNAARTAKIDGHPCRVCGSGWDVEYHHIVPRSKFPKGVDGVTSPANAMPLCHQCHQDHHTRGRDGRVPRTCLLPEETAFVLATKGEAWLHAWYPSD